MDESHRGFIENEVQKERRQVLWLGVAKELNDGQNSQRENHQFPMDHWIQ
jgi:hypothetical protein